MVDMGVREQDGTKGFRLKSQVEVSADRFFSTPLKHAAIEQQPESWYFHHMPTACDRTSSTIE